VIYEKKKSDKQEFWQKHVRAWKASGMTQAEYCRIHGLKDHRLTYYKLRFETFFECCERDARKNGFEIQ
jgi:hypothetical protein